MQVTWTSSQVENELGFNDQFQSFSEGNSEKFENFLEMANENTVVDVLGPTVDFNSILCDII